jgi:alkanesulfonate monooxygenase SsuD/methylene tetrahydromethanopterin reductase-like flavin-dependent oxidoreductase (luciferase family)
MVDRIAGIHIQGQSLPETVATIRRADLAGVKSVWLTSGGLGPDSLTTLAVAGTQTNQICLGSSIAVTWSRHPIAMIQQAVAVSEVAPGRFRLGIGPSHRPTIENTYGIAFERPLEQVREYTVILEQAFHGGQIDFDGKFFKVHAKVANPPNVPVYHAALRPAAYELAGEVAEGAISWVSPSAYLRDVARPALFAGAAKRRDGMKPRLVGHAFGLVSDDETAVKQLGRERLAGYTRMTFYQEMFAAAGYPEARDGVISDQVVEDLVLTGNEAKVAKGIQRFLDAGCDELIISLIPTGTDAEASIVRTFKLLGTGAF